MNSRTQIPAGPLVRAVPGYNPNVSPRKDLDHGRSTPEHSAVFSKKSRIVGYKDTVVLSPSKYENFLTKQLPTRVKDEFTRIRMHQDTVFAWARQRGYMPLPICDRSTKTIRFISNHPSLPSMVIIYEDNITVMQDCVEPGRHKVLYLNPCCVPELLAIPQFHLFTAAPLAFKNAGEVMYAGVYTMHQPQPERPDCSKSFYASDNRMIKKTLAVFENLGYDLTVSAMGYVSLPSLAMSLPKPIPVIGSPRPKVGLSRALHVSHVPDIMGDKPAARTTSKRARDPSPSSSVLPISKRHIRPY